MEGKTMTNYSNYSTHSELMEQIEEGIQMGMYPYEVFLSDGTCQIWFDESDEELGEQISEWNESNETVALSYETL